MRTINEVLEAVIKFAENDDNIRGLVLQGSTVNDNVKEDIFSDLDPLFYVKDTSLFTSNDEWFSLFGSPILFFKDSFKEYSDLDESYTRLIIYEDTFKIDFGFAPLSHIKHANDMPLYKVVIDKDNCIPLPQTTKEDRFYVKSESEETYNKALSEFYFDTSYVVKSLYRNELFFTKFMFNILQEKIEALLNIYLSINYEEKVNPGSKGRYYERYLDKKTWDMLLKTYSDANILNNIKALLSSIDLVHYLGTYIAKHLKYDFPEKMHQDTLEYLKKTIKLVKEKHNI
ncbi:aminoglycoside 6-adenylyltransferase [Candidatus Izimaplasma bacterium ZiA1]|uniref:aminoglycoside 6-adenylyltransferase n=1 Tax=Candidatus Izimoplasma sp. ZiA1 TaxID=2024899 RepID=UPI00143AB96B